MTKTGVSSVHKQKTKHRNHPNNSQRTPGGAPESYKKALVPKSPPKGSPKAAKTIQLFGQTIFKHLQKVMAGVNEACYRLLHPIAPCCRLPQIVAGCHSL